MTLSNLSPLEGGLLIFAGMCLIAFLLLFPIKSIKDE